MDLRLVIGQLQQKKVDSCAGYFEKGTKVKVIGKSYRGYDLEDEYGNRIIETGYDSIG